MTAVTVRSLTAGYGPNPVIDRLDLEVPDATITAVLGASGSGKTTLLRVLAGFLKPSCGTVQFGDRVVSRSVPNQIRSGGADTFVPPEKRRVGIVPQEGALFPHLTVAANVGFGLPRGSQARIGHVLELVGLADRARDWPHELSGGQQQRVALARALAPRPDVVLLDEPFSSLDAALRTRLRAEVRDLLLSVGSTAVLVTHDQDEAMTIADRLAVMRDGRIVQAGTPREVYEAPADLGVARFIGDAVELPANADPARTEVSCALGKVRVHPGCHRGIAGPAVVVVRPEQLRVTRRSPESLPPGSGIVRDTVFHGHDSVLWVELLEGPRIPVRVPAGQSLPGPGQAVVVEMTGEARLYPR